jgi:hypothetical protein
MMERIESTAVVFRRGSALILAVVLTSLLALVGVLFVMAARIDKMATSATADSRELGLAVDTVLAEINETLITDVPGVGSAAGYYEYPDTSNAWLAEAEPYESGGSYYWRQISNVAGLPAADTRNVRIRLVEEREPIQDPNGAETNADADGDGAGDAQWFPVPGVMSSKGRPIYAAVRVLDNGGMLNVNTGFKFDPGDANTARVDGRSQLQVNVLALASAPASRHAVERSGFVSPRQQYAKSRRVEPGRLRAAGPLAIPGPGGLCRPELEQPVSLHALRPFG